MKKLYRKGTVHPSPPLISDHLSFLPVAILTLAAALSQEDKEVLAYLISCSSGELSGNRRNTHKSTSPNSSNSGDSAAVHGGVSGGSGAEKVLSGNFSGKRRATHQKSVTPNSVSEKSVGGSRIASVNGGGVSGGGCVDKVLSGDFSGNWRTTHQKSATPNSVSGNSGGGSTIATAHGGANHVASFNCYCFSCYMCYWVKWDSSPNRQLIHEILDAYEDGLLSKKEKSKKERRNNKNGSSNGGGSTSCELKKSSSESSLSKNGSCSGFGSCQTDPVEETSGSRGDGSDEKETGGGEEGSEKGSVRKFVSYLGEKIWSIWT
ncbi:hypothetical protein RND71_022290 [Anisodus tanguticus]|uniref:Uncharacterized protein n=1 Tax=Anisodus tanguticus TaxID=243964 RepID=A0AAE1RYB1_9SOLA|nr:hypothetical protein RND71_022290 [Anisodus tanguticus]